MEDIFIPPWKLHRPIVLGTSLSLSSTLTHKITHELHLPMHAHLQNILHMTASEWRLTYN